MRDRVGQAVFLGADVLHLTEVDRSIAQTAALGRTRQDSDLVQRSRLGQEVDGRHGEVALTIVTENLEQFFGAQCLQRYW